MTTASKTAARRTLDAALRARHEVSLQRQLTVHLPGVVWVAQYRFHPERKWAADLAAPSLKLLLEVQGGTAIHGARSHAGIVGYERDAERLAEAQIAGFDLLYFTPAQVADGRALKLVERWLQRRLKQEP